jgi:hypothetical protein
MKSLHPHSPTSSTTRASSTGIGSGRSRRKSTRAHQPKAQKSKAPTALPAQPTYDAGLRYDTPGLHYAVTEPAPPVPEGGKVRLELKSRTDADVAAFGEAVKNAMTGNPNFPDPTPSDAAYDEFLSVFEGLLSDLENMRVEMKNLTERKDIARANFQAALTQRAQYVEIASNGNPNIIATSGLSLRRPPTPVGQLPYPQNLRIDVSQNNGALIIRWLSVAKAKGYVLQMAEAVGTEPRNWTQVYMGGKFSTTITGLVPGKVYEFRVATVGGSTGQSDWSPVQSRMVA